MPAVADELEDNAPGLATLDAGALSAAGFGDDEPGPASVSESEAAPVWGWVPDCG
jgi:hypothetical protein